MIIVNFNTNDGYLLNWYIAATQVEIVCADVTLYDEFRVDLYFVLEKYFLEN